MKNIVEKIKKSHFISNVTILSGATVIAHFIAVITAPILSRLYTPDDFGILAVFVTILSLVSVIASLRYETAIPLPENNTKAVNLLGVCVLLIFAMTVILFLIVMFYRTTISELLKIKELKYYLWLLPLSFFGAGMYQILTYWAIRQNDYKTIASSKIYKISGQVGIPVFLGIFKKGPLGLILGDFASRFAGTGLLIKRLFPKKVNLIKNISFKNMYLSAKEYKRFPQYASLAILVHTINMQIPVIFFSILYGSEVVGWFSFGQRVFVTPLTIIGSSVSQVFYGKASILARENVTELRRAFKKIVIFLSLSFLLPVLIVIFWGPEIMSLIFGEKWNQAGKYLQISSFAIYVMMVVGPVYQILNILQKQTWILLSDIIGFLIIIPGFFIIYHFNLSPELAIICYSLSLFFSYSLLFIFCIITFKSKKKLQI